MVFSFRKKNKENLENLRQVLHIIQENELKSLKSEKCVFNAGNFIYLGFKINKNGVTPVKEKMKT